MLGPVLKEWRKTRGKSQLKLALEAAVSPRHLSFVESGHAQASRELVLRLAEALGLGLRERNAMLVAAGFAAEYGEHDFWSEEMREVRQATSLLLRAHEPYPALVLNVTSTILDVNPPALDWLSGAEVELGKTRLMDLVFMPGALRDSIQNWGEVAAYSLRRLRELVQFRGARSAVADVLAYALTQPGVAELSERQEHRGSAALLPVHLVREGQRSSWLMTITTFGGAQDALVEELTIEQFHPLHGVEAAARRAAIVR